MKRFLLICIFISVLAVAGIASAVPITLNEVGVNDSAVVNAHFGGSINSTVNALAGYYQLSINGAKAVNGFCVDPAWSPTSDQLYDLRAIDANTNYAKAAYLFSLSKNFDAAAVQIAIWKTIMGTNDFIWYNQNLKVNGKLISTEVDTMLNDLNSIPSNFNLGLYSLAASPGNGPSYGKGYQDYIVENTAPVPEPGTMVLLGFGLLGLAIYGKRRMNKDV